MDSIGGTTEHKIHKININVYVRGYKRIGDWKAMKIMHRQIMSIKILCAVYCRWSYILDTFVDRVSFPPHSQMYT